MLDKSQHLAHLPLEIYYFNHSNFFEITYVLNLKVFDSKITKHLLPNFSQKYAFFPNSNGPGPIHKRWKNTVPFYILHWTDRSDVAHFLMTVLLVIVCLCTTITYPGYSQVYLNVPWVRTIYKILLRNSDAKLVIVGYVFQINYVHIYVNFL